MSESQFEDPVYLIEFVYNSSARVRYWMKNFSIKDNKAEWECFSAKQQPLHLNLDDIESIHQLDARESSELRDPTDTRLGWER